MFLFVLPPNFTFSGAPFAARRLSRRRQPGGVGKATSGLEECQQIDVELVFVRVRETVGRARVNL
jgi:hypothetical protein